MRKKVDHADSQDRVNLLMSLNDIQPPSRCCSISKPQCGHRLAPFATGREQIGHLFMLELPELARSWGNAVADLAHDRSVVQ